MVKKTLCILSYEFEFCVIILYSLQKSFNNALHVFERFRKMVQVYLQNVFVAKIVMSQLLNPEILSEHVLPLPTNQRRYLVNILCTF